MTMRSVAILLGFVCFWSFGRVEAVETRIHTDNSYDDFAAGQLVSTSLSNRGRITVAPSKKKRCDLQENLVLSMAAGKKGDLYVGTGDRGYIFRVDAKDKVTTLSKLFQPLVTALAVDDEGALYAAAAPGGNIYRILPKDSFSSPTLFCRTKQSYVWSLLFDKDRSLLAGTGSPGKALRISDKGTTTVLLATDCENVTGLYRTRDDRLLAITQKKARVYEITGKDKAFVVYEGKLEEARGIAEDAEGNLYVALNAIEGRPRLPTPIPTISRPMPQSLTISIPNPTDDKEQPPKTPAPTPIAPTARKPETKLGGGTSVIVKIDRDGFATLFWTSPETPIHAITSHPGGKNVIASAGSKGRLFSIGSDGEYSILFAVNQSLILCLLWRDKSLVLGTGDGASVYSSFGEEQDEGVYLSSSIDVGSPSSWGRIRWKGCLSGKDSVKLAVRMGNSSEPDDKLWGLWSKNILATDGSIPIPHSVGRYLQYRLTLHKTGCSNPFVESLETYYLPLNRAPTVKAVKVENIQPPPETPKTLPRLDKEPAPGHNPAAERVESEPVKKEKGDISALVKPFSNTGKKKITWEAEDPNQDTMEADVYYRCDTDAEWKLIEKRVPGSSVEFLTTYVPDGIYRVQVLVSDRPSNNFNDSKQSEYVSGLFTIDNTPPKISTIKVKRDNDSSLNMSFTVSDKLSYISDVRFSIDARNWQRVSPKDRMYDSLREEFLFMVKFASKGEHSITLMATDAEGNTTVSKNMINR